MRVDTKELRPGDILGRYQLLLPVARGGMGQVWAARPNGARGADKLVAVKTILPSGEDAEQLESMLLAEASLASLIRHPNVAETFEHGEQDGVLHLVMEWVDGEPLDHILRAARPTGGIPILVAVHLIVQALRGLQAAHDARNAEGDLLGLVHRDISPQNLLVTYSGVVKLVDFGVAKATQQMSQPTQLGEVKGKFAYMAPEQVQGEQLDARADVFAMGIVLYRISTGLHPFKADNPAATIRNILMRGPAHPSRLVTGYPPLLENVVLKALARDKSERFSSAEEMMLALEKTLPAPLRDAGPSDTEALLRRLFEMRIDQRAKALRVAAQEAEFPRSQPTMRAVALGASESPFAPVLPRRSLTRSLPPKRKRRGWPALLAIAASLVLPLALDVILSRPAPAGSRYDAQLYPIAIDRADAAAVMSAASPAPVAGETAQAGSAPGSMRDASLTERGPPSRAALPKKFKKTSDERR